MWRYCGRVYSTTSQIWHCSSMPWIQNVRCTPFKRIKAGCILKTGLSFPHHTTHRLALQLSPVSAENLENLNSYCSYEDTVGWESCVLFRLSRLLHPLQLYSRATFCAASLSKQYPVISNVGDSARAPLNRPCISTPL